MTIQVTPSGQACGATVTGVDLTAPLDDETIADIRAAWLEHLVLAFPDQPMSNDDLERFTLGFGPFGDLALSTRQAIVAVQSFATVLMCSSLLMLAFITDRRRLEVQRSQLELQLRHSQKLESIGTLAGGVAHDLNNPLTGVMNYAQLMQEELPADSPAQEYAGEILTESEHMAGIVRNLLTFARQDAEHRERTDLERIVDSTVRLVGSMLKKDGIVLEVDIPPDLHPIVCNPQEIRQVVMNLLTNARDALNERYPERHPDKSVRIGAENFDSGSDPWVRIVVEDRGAGISPEIRDRVFDPFRVTHFDRIFETDQGSQ